MAGKIDEATVVDDAAGGLSGMLCLRPSSLADEVQPPPRITPFPQQTRPRAQGLQNALWSIRGTPREHCSDSPFRGIPQSEQGQRVFSKIAIARMSGAACTAARISTRRYRQAAAVSAGRFSLIAPAPVLDRAVPDHGRHIGTARHDTWNFGRTTSSRSADARRSEPFPAAVNEAASLRGVTGQISENARSDRQSRVVDRTLEMAVWAFDGAVVMPAQAQMPLTAPSTIG
ncbi:hypothetical protein [Mesorhizobium sp. M0118]|uniref:hypothetical protein n=1 Tax=Mesorhizobium sp. M0118 TaxID=2956884 RepID=UPI00333B7F23